MLTGILIGLSIAGVILLLVFIWLVLSWPMLF